MALDSKEKAFILAKSAMDKKAKEVVILDMRKLLNITDYFVICNGENERQIKAIADKIEDEMYRRNGFFLGKEGTYRSGWFLMDFGDVIGHIFMPEIRNFYDLESLWGDAPSVDFKYDLEV